MMGKYIELKALFKTVEDYASTHPVMRDDELFALFCSVDATDVRPVVHGEWEHKVTSSYAGGGATFCSVCGYGYSDGAFFEVEDFDYCPHCGATMKVDRRDIELL